MSFRFGPDQERLSARGFASVAHVPVLFTGTGRYFREANRYLRERATLTWPQDRNPATTGYFHSSAAYPRPKGLKKVADSLVRFFGWLEANRLDWRAIQYDPDVRLFRDDQATGVWSRDQAPLATSTIESRIDYATDFLRWAAIRELRPPFDIPQITRYRTFATGTSSTRSTKVFVSRAGRARRDPVNLRLPELGELRAWLAQIRARRGYTKTLACRTILASGMRLEEVAQLPMDFIPMRPDQWHMMGGAVRFLIIAGTKFGKSRYVTLPTDLAYELHRFRTTRRINALVKWSKAHRGAKKPTQMFLSSYDGSPLSGPTIYDAWISSRIYDGWSPHLGRHTWACYQLLAELCAEAQMLQVQPSRMPVSWIEATAQTIISLSIQPNLGHVSEQTTRIYLQWLRSQLALPATYDTWHTFLEGTELAR